MSNPQSISPSSPLKTHYMGIMLTMIAAIIAGIQSNNGTPVNLSDPTVWAGIWGFIVTIYGFIRNKPQGTILG